MPATPVKAKGTTFQIDTFTGTNYKSLSGPQVSVDFADTTVLGDTWESNTPTLAHGGSISASAFFSPADAAVLRTMTTAQIDEVEPYDGILTYSDESTDSFGVWLEQFNVSGIEIGGVVECEMTYKVSGEVVYDSGE